MAYSLLGETFAEYAIAMSFLLLRFYARIKVAGIRNLGIGDIFAGMAVVGSHSIMSQDVSVSNILFQIFYTLTTAGIYLLGR